MRFFFSFLFLGHLQVLFSITLFYFEMNVSIAETCNMIYEQVFVNWRSSLKLSVPAILYTIQNNTIFLALNNLPGLVFQVSNQGKIFTTALFSVILLNRKLNYVQWTTLFTLAMGVVLVQYRPPTENDDAPKVTTTTHSPTVDELISGPGADNGDTGHNFVLGMIAVLVGACCSGLAGVYFEKVLKGTQSSLWIRNIQLGLMSAIIGTIMACYHDGVTIREQGFLGGFNGIVWLTVTTHGVGGLLVAMVIKYADAITKGFASAISSVLTGIVGVLFLAEDVPGVIFVVGMTLVLTSSFFYSQPQVVTECSTSN